MSAIDLAQAIAAKELSPAEVIRTILERIDAINPEVNAYVTVTADTAMDMAKKAEEMVMKKDKLGALHGVPFSVKDVTFTQGVRTTMGSKLLSDHIPDQDAVHVARLKKAGAILLGKTNTPEFAAKAVTENNLFGVTRNPWDLTRTSGGSSGGAAAALASGLGPLATGNDVGGSIRIPASCCGVVGLKPQFGRVPNYPLFHLWEGILHEGPMTRTVKDAAIMLDIMGGVHWGDRFSLPTIERSYANSLKGGTDDLKIAWTADLGYARVSGEVRQICEKAIKTFSEMGAIIEEACPDFENPEKVYFALINSELSARLTLFGSVEELREKLHPWIIDRTMPWKSSKAEEYIKANFARQEVAARLCQFMEKYDLLLTPTLGVPAWPIGLPNVYPTEIDGKPIGALDWMLTHPFDLSGQPALSIPVGWTDDGLPVGLQIVGPPHDELIVLRAAAAFEEAQPWNHRKPYLNTI
jgi:aspartyl-tRNA(Asn)/glutamyl-tRNA(Gln) amidotransferase subunit A